MAAPDWFDEISLPVDGPPWLAMGLTRCPEERWLWPDEHRADELAEKERLLAERHDEVFAAVPGTEEAGAEVLGLVEQWLTAHDVPRSEQPTLAEAHPLEIAGRLVQEDLCLVVEHDGVPHLDAGSLCFPSHWRLTDKVGLPMAAVHGPVPRYDVDLSERVDRYLTRLRAGVIGVRRNWTVHESPALFAPERPPHDAISEDEVATHLWLRSERQTLRRLPETGAVLFTIRVQQAPFGSVAERPGVAAALAGRLRAQPAELTEMNGLAPHRDVVLQWLDSAAAQPL